MFDTKVSDALLARINGPDKEEHLKGSYVMTVIFSKYLRSWLGDNDTGRAPWAAVREAGTLFAHPPSQIALPPCQIAITPSPIALQSAHPPTFHKHPP